MKFVLIGNVDHGKSTFGGHLIIKTNNIKDRSIQKKSKKWSLSGLRSFFIIPHFSPLLPTVNQKSYNSTLGIQYRNQI